MKNNKEFIALFNLIKEQNILTQLNIKKTSELFRLSKEELLSIINEKNVNTVINKINLFLSDELNNCVFEEKEFFVDFLSQYNFNVNNFNELLKIYKADRLKKILDKILSIKSERKIIYILKILENPQIINLIISGIISEEDLEKIVYEIVLDKKTSNSIVFSRFLTNKKLLTELEKERINLNQIFELLNELGKYAPVTKEICAERIIGRHKIISLYLTDEEYRNYFKELIIKLKDEEEYKVWYISKITKNKYILGKLNKKNREILLELINGLLEINDEELLEEILLKTKEINSKNTEEKLNEINLMINQEILRNSDKNTFVKINTK